MFKFSILGVSHISDLYPNVKYKIALLQTMADLESRVVIYNMGGGAFYEGMSATTTFSKIPKILRFLRGYCSVVCRFFLSPSPNVYIVYPAVFLVLGFLLVPKRLRPVIFMDAFISLYDTIVNDRRLYSATSLRARLLYRMERAAFGAADHILVDTQENGLFYSKLFDIPRHKFHEVPLSIPQLSKTEKSRKKTESFFCVFMGSLVPLHGIETILQAVAALSINKEIHFVIIGDGQDGSIIRHYLSENPNANVTWYQGFYDTDFIAGKISEADLCLGIFGKSDKADRVLPYKLYYYAALGKPFLTRRTSCLSRILEETEEAGLWAGNSAEIVALISTFFEDRKRLYKAASAAQNLYQRRLVKEVIRDCLMSIFRQHAK